MVTPVAQYCVASHDTFTSDDNIFVKMWRIGSVKNQIMLILFYFFPLNNIQSIPRIKSSDYPWVAFAWYLLIFRKTSSGKNNYKHQMED